MTKDEWKTVALIKIRAEMTKRFPTSTLLQQIFLDGIEFGMNLAEQTLEEGKKNAAEWIGKK